MERGEKGEGRRKIVVVKDGGLVPCFSQMGAGGGMNAGNLRLFQRKRVGFEIRLKKERGTREVHRRIFSRQKWRLVWGP